MELTITWTGICAIVKDSGRATLFLPNGTKARRNCEDTADIPEHHAYVKYLFTDETAPHRKEDGASGGERYALLREVEISLSVAPEPPLSYPAPRRVIPGVVEMSRVYPGYRLRSELENLSKVPPSLISACMRLEGGEFRKPNPRGLMWHFFPPRGQLVRQPLAQAVAIRMVIPGDTVTFYTRKLGSGGGPQKFLTLKGDRIGIVIGNTPLADIFPVNLNSLPPVGPDYHFELYYDLIERDGDFDCPPIAFFEGIPQLIAQAHCGGHMPMAAPARTSNTREVMIIKEGGHISLGGGNCPPTQWP